MKIHKKKCRLGLSSILAGKLEGERFFHQVPGLCEAVAYMCTVSCIVSLGSITLMSFSRFVFICHNKYYKTIFRKGTCIAMCVGLYLIGIFLVLLNLAGIGGHSFDRKSLVCIWDRMATYYYTVTFSVVLVWIPVLFTVGLLRMWRHITCNGSQSALRAPCFWFTPFSPHVGCLTLLSSLRIEMILLHTNHIWLLPLSPIYTHLLTGLYTTWRTKILILRSILSYP